MSHVQIRVTYNYYSSQRTTPVYLLERELENYTFDEFRRRIIQDVPHLAKAISLRWTVDDDSQEVDLSSNYFNFQIKNLLGKGKNISINVIEFESPAPTTSKYTNDTGHSNSNVVDPSNMQQQQYQVNSNTESIGS